MVHFFLGATKASRVAGTTPTSNLLFESHLLNSLSVTIRELLSDLFVEAGREQEFTHFNVKCNI